MTAAVYFEQSELWGNQAEPYQAQVLADILDLVPSDVASVLDVGCGDGLITNSLPLHLKVVGLDPSPQALQHVRRETRCGSIADMPFGDKSFDLVMTTDVIEHLPPDVLAQAVRELTRVARRYVLICVPHREQYQANFTRCARCGHTYHINHHQRSWCEENLVTGLLPPHWRVQEVRYSGLFRPNDDTTVELRHKLDLWNPWPGAVCPSCGSKGQRDTPERQQRIHKCLDCLAANHWWAETPRRFRFTDRSEIIALFSCAPRVPRLYRPAEPSAEPGPLLAIDFTNPLQRVGGWTISPLWPCYLGSAEHYRAARGIRVARRGFFASEIPVRFPVQAAPGDALVLEVETEDKGALVHLFAWDSLNEERVALDKQKVAPGRHSVRLVLSDAVRKCHADRYGFLAIFSILGNVLVRRAEYVPDNGQPGPTVPWVFLAPGHQVFTQRTAEYVRSWGFIALEGGRLPLPEELEPLSPASGERGEECLSRLGKKRADDLLFRIEQEFAEPDDPGLQLVRECHRALLHRGRRVLVLSHMYPSPAQPGLGPFVHEQVSALRVRSGIDVRVVSCTPFWANTKHPVKIARAYRAYRKLFEDLHWESHDGVPVLYLPYLVGGLFRPWLHALTYRQAVLAASDWLRAHFDFELIHAHTSYLDGTAALALSRKYDVPYLLTEHTGPFRLLTDHPLMRRSTVRALTHADKVFCVSGSLAGDVRGVLPAELHGKVEVLHNGVDAALFYPPSRWTPEPAAPRFLAVMSLDENKNPLLLLDAFRRLLADVPGASLLLVGQGPLKDVVADRIRKTGLDRAVSLLGFRSRSEVARLLREECDALVVSSNSETFGVVLIEALASGKPVVSTDCGGPRDIITDPAVGILCPPRDAQALAAALRQVADALGSYQPEAIRRHALDHYDYFNLASRLAEEYDLVRR